ncbi:MAG: trypsin-like peptidase domain-containing protein [Patescibacteria group bacterium]
MKRFLFKHTFVTLLITALAGVVVTLGVLGVLFWRYQPRVLSYLNARVPIAPTALLPDVKTPASALGIFPEREKTASDLTITQVVEKANKSVVSIEVYQQVPVYENTPTALNFNDFFSNFFIAPQTRRQIGTEEKKVGGGTGFFVTSNGMLVTNRHVVGFQGATFKIVTSAGKKYTATLLASDPVMDVAILKVSGGSFTPLSFADSSRLQLGQSVIAIGFALGQFNNSISSGIISGLGRSVVAGNGQGQNELLDSLIQTDAAINPGNSGGPLLNLKGEVVGVNVAIAQGSQSVGFALPANMVSKIVDSVRATGSITRPYLGVNYVQVTPLVKQQNNLTVDYGILVIKSSSGEGFAVIPNSPAQKAGILENDVILSIDGVELTSDTSFINIIRQKKVGQKVSLLVLRNGGQITLTATLEAAK